MSLPFPHIDPILIQIGPLAIRWYSLAYIGGIIFGWFLVKKDLKKHPQPGLTDARIEDIVLWAIGGIILGGRLGYTLFYKPDYYLSQPLEILYIWQGGMSFHGGAIGFALAFFLFCRRYHIVYLPLMDVLACVVPIGLGLGRIANFINGELWGRPTDVAWGMVFPHADGQVRHPSQLYEAAMEGVILFAILMILLKATRLRQFPGFLSGVFLVGYGVFRIIAEFFREPDIQLGFLWAGATMGQLLSMPMLILGAYLMIRARRA